LGEDGSVDSAIETFRSMMWEGIAPELRRIGFKGSGQSFSLPSDENWVLLGFQKMMSSNSQAVRFTVNVTAFPKQAWAEERQARDFLPERPSPNTWYGYNLWQRRIGHLLPDRQDHWWLVTPGRSTESVAGEVLDAIHTYVLPAIEAQLGAAE
jgi:hypothetical protein